MGGDNGSGNPCSRIELKLFKRGSSVSDSETTTEAHCSLRPSTDDVLKTLRGNPYNRLFQTVDRLRQEAESKDARIRLLEAEIQYVYAEANSERNRWAVAVVLSCAFVCALVLVLA